MGIAFAGYCKPLLSAKQRFDMYASNFTLQEDLPKISVSDLGL
jgi:hypothetical protein